MGHVKIDQKFNSNTYTFFLAYRNSFWCLSRRDDLQQKRIVPPSATVIENVFNQGFSITFESNGTHTKCQNNADLWIINNDLFNTPLFCVTSSTLTVKVFWSRNQNSER